MESGKRRDEGQMALLGTLPVPGHALQETSWPGFYLSDMSLTFCCHLPMSMPTSLRPIHLPRLSHEGCLSRGPPSLPTEYSLGNGGSHNKCHGAQRGFV